MGDRDNRAAVERYFESLRARDFDGMSAVRHDDDFVQEWPQMRERTRGKDNARAINENHPALPKPTVPTSATPRMRSDFAMNQPSPSSRPS
ncbi:MAG: hypothetical protein M3Q23_10400 [Actinomycetota bacterium]|nr:hypothetical protein [Actinomycetota bacterium]